MKLLKKLKRFKLSEDGAVTVDWVVLTAGVVTLAYATIASSNSNVVGFSERVENALGAFF